MIVTWSLRSAYIILKTNMYLQLETERFLSIFDRLAM